MKMLKTLIAICVLLYVSTTNTHALHTVGTSSIRPYTAAPTAKTPAASTYLHDGGNRHALIETCTTCDEDGKALIIRIRIPRPLDTAIALAVIALATAGITLLRRRRHAGKQSATAPTDIPAGPAPASGSDENDHRPSAPQTAREHAAEEDRSTADTTDSTVAATGNDRYMIRRLDEFIAEHISEVDLTVNDLATAVYMSRSNLFRRLKTLYGVTPNEYLRNKRLNYAADLLRQNRYNISDICFMVGFSSPSYFASCFKKYFGTLPKNYIREE